MLRSDLRSVNLSHLSASFLERHSGWFVVAMIVATLLLIVPMIVMAPDEQASDNPGGGVYDLEEAYNANLPPRFHGAFFIAESRDEDILTRLPLLELLGNAQRLRQLDLEGKLNPEGLPEQPYLFSGFDVDRQQPIVGIFTIADAVNEVLINHPMLNTTLEAASEDEVKLAIHLVLSDPKTEGMEC